MSGGGDTRVDVPVPSCERPAALAVTLTGVPGHLRVAVSHQGERTAGLDGPDVTAITVGAAALRDAGGVRGGDRAAA